MDTLAEVLLKMAADRIEAPLRALNPEDEEKQKRGISCGFRFLEGCYVGHLTWKLVKYRGKSRREFVLEVFSLDPKRKAKVSTERIVPGGLGKKRLVSLPALNLEATRSFSQEV